MGTMSLAERSRHEVERRVARLRAEFGEFPVEQLTVENDPSYFEHGREYIEGGHVGAAGMVIHREDGRVLLIYHSEAETWGPPGGGHEPGETLEETALREVRKETTVECQLTGVFRAERKRFVHEEDPEQRGYLLELFFKAEYVSGTPDASGDDEITAARWFEEPPENDLDFRVEPGSGIWTGAAP